MEWLLAGLHSLGITRKSQINWHGGGCGSDALPLGGIA